jgi:predicted lysophospholipase L1 biosynthesis ABC-type transport system permease subunit
MKEDQDYIRDIAEMRSMMERTSKFMSLSGLAGIMAGIYALAGAMIAYLVFDFPALQLAYSLAPGSLSREKW